MVDATGQTLGRLATRIARTLQGKEKAFYTPHLLTGDYVVVVNAAKIKVTGKKPRQKVYYRHPPGRMGSMKTTLLKDMLATHPERVVLFAVKGMLPQTQLGSHMLSRLKVYAGEPASKATQSEPKPDVKQEAKQDAQKKEG